MIRSNSSSVQNLDSTGDLFEETRRVSPKRNATTTKAYDRPPTGSPLSTLPTELLETIFIAFIWEHDEKGWRMFLRRGPALVCKRWEAGTRRLLMHRLRILSKPSTYKKDVDIIITRKIRGQWAATRSLHVTVPFFHEPHRLSDLVELFGDTLQSLVISGHWDLKEGKNYIGLPLPEERDSDTPITFPEIRDLNLTAIPALDALSILWACNLRKITYLELSAFRRTADEPFLDGIVLPNLRYLALGFALAGLESTRENFAQATPALESLQLVVAPDSLVPLASHLETHGPKKLKTLTVWVWDPMEWIRDPAHPNVKPLLAVVEKNGWNHGFTLSGKAGMLSWSLVQPTKPGTDGPLQPINTRNVEFHTRIP